MMPKISDQDIVLRLFFKNPQIHNAFNKYAEIEQKISRVELYGGGDVELASVFNDNIIVNIKYQDGLLSIKTSAKVDIFLSGTIPAQALHIETHGGCALIDGQAKDLSLGLFIKSNGIVLDMPIKSTGFMALLPATNAAHSIQIKQPIDASLLRIDAMDLLLGAKVQFGKAMVQCKLLHNFADGELLIAQPKSPLKQTYNLTPLSSRELLGWDEVVDKHDFIEEHDALRGKIYRLTESLLIAKILHNEGIIKLSKTLIKGCSSVQLLPNSNTIINNVKLLSKELHIHNLANVTGFNAVLEVDGQFNLDGSCIIDKLVVHARDITVAGVLWGDTSLSMQIKDNASFYGIVGAKQTTIKAKYILVTAVLGNEALYHETFVNGGIIGTATLTLKSLACVRAGGAYLYGPTICLNNGIDVGLFSYIRTYNLVKNCLYEYCTLEGVLLCKPEYMSDLINPNKLLRVAEMIGSNFPVLRGFVSFLNIGMMAGYGCKMALTTIFTSLRDDPNLLRQLNNLGQAVAKNAQYGAESLVNLAMGDWNSDRLKEFVEVILQANGLRVYANTVISQATGALIFANDMQNLTYSNPDFNLENIKATTSRKLESAKSLTVADALHATKNVGDNLAEAVGAKLEETKSILETPESRAKFINNNFTVVKKNTTSSNEQQTVDTPVQTVAETTDERITLVQAAKDVVLNQVSEIINAPTTIFNRVTGAVDAIQSINPADTVSQLLDSTNDKLDALVTAGKAVRNAEPTPFPIQAPTISEDFIWGMAKESAKLLAPSVYTTSFVSDTGGFILTGNYIVNSGFYRNSGMVMSLGTSVHSLYDTYNYGTIFSERYTESARNRNNYGVVSAAEANIFVGDNNEHGATEASRRMVFDIKNQYVAQGAKFMSTGKTSGRISGKMITHGQQDLRNGHLQHDGTTEFGTTADTTLKNMTLELEHELDFQGKTHLEQLNVTCKKNITFKSESNTFVSNVIFHAPSVYREDGSIVNLDNKLLLDAEHVGSGLNSALNGTPDSLFAIKSQTVDELGAHNVGHGVFDISNLSSQDAHRFAYGLDEYNNKTYGQSVLVTTESTESLIYTPSARADGAATTLLTKGVTTLPPGYDRAKGIEFNTYKDAERFVAGYECYNLPDVQLGEKSFGEKFFESLNEGANVAIQAGIKSGSIPGAIVVCIATPISWFAGHKARKIARRDNAILEAERVRRANIQREIDARQLALDERNDLTELCNIRNDARINNFFDDIASSNDLNVDIKQYQEYITSSYDARRLELQQQHDDYLNTIHKYSSMQLDRIRKLGATKVHGGFAYNVGANGHTVSATYGVGSNGNMSYGSIPIYEKTYSYGSPSQQPVEATSNRDSTYQWPDLLPKIHDEIEEPTHINEPLYSDNLDGSTQFINTINHKTYATNTSEQTMLGSIGYQTVETVSETGTYRNIWDVSESRRFDAELEYSLGYLLNTAYRGASFGLSHIGILSAGNALEYGQLNESLEDQLAREQGYMDQGRSLQQFLKHPIDNIKSFAVNYVENTNYAYQEALTSGNYFQAAMIQSNMHCDVAESTIGLIVGGTGAYKVASKVGKVATTQGSRALLWSAQHSMRFPLVFSSDVFIDSLGSSTLNSLGAGGFDALVKATELKNPIKKRVSVLNKDHRYYTPPKTLPGFKDSQVVNSKSERKRWKLPDKRILEWDYQHGEIEMYDKRGRHLGAYDPNTGAKLKNAVSTRKIEI